MLTTLVLSFLNILVVSTIIFPLLFIFLIPILCYRLCVLVASKVVRRDFVSIVSCADSIFANDKFNTCPHSTTLIACKIVGDIDLDTLRKDILNCIVVKDDATGKPRYSPFFQTLEK